MIQTNEKADQHVKKLDSKTVKERGKVSKSQIKSVLVIIVVGIFFYLLFTLYVKNFNGDFLPFLGPTFISIALLSLLFELIDSSTGMGFGTSLSPILLIMGFEPLEVIPVLLISESITGVFSGFLHHKFQNYHLSLKPLNDTTRFVLIFIGFGSIGIILSIILTYYTFSTPEILIKTYISILIIVMALISLFKSKIKKEIDPNVSPRKLLKFGLIASINKGIGGGGYGPVITLGAITSGINPKNAIAISSLSEGVISILGFLTFVGISFAGINFNLILLPAVFLGSLLGGIISPYIVRLIPSFVWKYLVPINALLIGIFLLLKIFIL